MVGLVVFGFGFRFGRLALGFWLWEVLLSAPVVLVVLDLVCAGLVSPFLVV